MMHMCPRWLSPLSSRSSRPGYRRLGDGPARTLGCGVPRTGPSAARARAMFVRDLDDALGSECKARGPGSARARRLGGAPAALACLRPVRAASMRARSPVEATDGRSPRPQRLPGCGPTEVVVSARSLRLWDDPQLAGWARGADHGVGGLAEANVSVDDATASKSATLPRPARVPLSQRPHDIECVRQLLCSADDAGKRAINSLAGPLAAP
jgi:hypothetical protein